MTAKETAYGSEPPEQMPVSSGGSGPFHCSEPEQGPYQCYLISYLSPISEISGTAHCPLMFHLRLRSAYTSP